MAPSLPPQGILIVCHLPDPNPGQLLAAGGWQLWERAAQNSLLYCWRTAAYPARQSVPASANSVWFGDRAEWLACLSWDLARGVARDHWWWQTALRAYAHHSPSETLTAIWLEESQALPAAIALLWQWEGAGIRDLFLAFSEIQTQQLIAQLALTYELPPLPENSQLLAILMPLLPNPIRSFLPILTTEHQGLLALCLTLPQALSLLRSPITVNLADEDQDEPPSRAVRQYSQGETADWQAPNIETLETTLSPDLPIESPSIPLFPTIASDRPIVDRSSLGDRPSTSQAVPPITPESSVDPSPIPQPSPIIPDIPTQPTNSPELGILTSLGGLWYLVNVLINLNWLSDLPPLDPWYQLLAITQALLPAIPPDPIWGILTELASDSPAETHLQLWQAQALERVNAYLSEYLAHPADFLEAITEPATLYLNRTHVDLTFSLDRVRLDIRQAGLDRDPGWVPELARAIAFHYE
jgi:hypothetical protein